MLHQSSKQNRHRHLKGSTSSSQQRRRPRHNNHLHQIHNPSRHCPVAVPRARRRRRRQLLRARRDGHLEPLGRRLVAAVRERRLRLRLVRVLDRGAEQDGADGGGGGGQGAGFGELDVGVVAEGFGFDGRGEAEFGGAAVGGVGLGE